MGEKIPTSDQRDDIHYFLLFFLGTLLGPLIFIYFVVSSSNEEKKYSTIDKYGANADLLDKIVVAVSALIACPAFYLLLVPNWNL